MNSRFGARELRSVVPVRRGKPEPSNGAGVAKPILKWAGGKSRLLPDILAKLPERIATYYEPFAGGAAVFFSLARQRRFKNAVLADRNRELVDLYRTIKRDVHGLIRLLKTDAFSSYSRDEYYRVRALDPTRLDAVERAARLIYLNRTGYNGLYRVNRAGRFNVPFGRYKAPKICDEPRLLMAASLLKGVKLKVSDFADVCELAEPGDAVYFDPPYVPLSKTSSFTAYHHEAFGLDDHRRLAEVFTELGERNVTAVLSNSDTPATRELYGGFAWEPVHVLRPINSQSTGRGSVAEILVVNHRPAKRRSAGGKRG
jgi:DNA adenine methylase